MEDEELAPFPALLPPARPMHVSYLTSTGTYHNGWLGQCLHNHDYVNAIHSWAR